jgi:hypothetical protein
MVQTIQIFSGEFLALFNPGGELPTVKLIVRFNRGSLVMKETEGENFCVGCGKHFCSLITFPV